MRQSIIQVDSFTDKPFAGNPAGVCFLDGPAKESWMRSVASEMNLSETAFFYKQGKDYNYNLRWFTPVAEVEMCGHATLASAHVLFKDNHVPHDNRITFHTLSGPLYASLNGEWIELNFPAKIPREESIPENLESALGFKPSYFAKAGEDCMAVCDSEDTIRNLTPNISAIEKLPTRGLIVTARGSGDYNFISRFFAPAVGIPEDPVTGSAHCVLAPYWMNVLGKTEMVGYQASPRGGAVRVRVEDDRVILAGKAVIVIRGELYT
ncbi:MAG: PhzF family phenazine biosynthesis protein [candidate division Zixibacteria bacterium]